MHVNIEFSNYDIKTVLRDIFYVTRNYDEERIKFHSKKTPTNQAYLIDVLLACASTALKNQTTTVHVSKDMRDFLFIT